MEQLLAASSRMPCWLRWRASRRLNSQSALDRLIEAGLLFRQGVPPNATYLFKHALVQDAAYGTLLREPRRALHARIAETLESQFTDIAENRPELLARHCTEAGLIEKAAAFGARPDSGHWNARLWSRPWSSLPAPSTKWRPLPATPVASRADQASSRAHKPSHACQRVVRRKRRRPWSAHGF